MHSRRIPFPPRRPIAVGCVVGLACWMVTGCDVKSDSEAPRRLRMGHVYEVKSPTHTFGASQLNGQLQQFRADLEIRIYPAAQLGNEAELLEQLVAGEIDLVIAGPSFLAMWYPPLGVFDAAYVFEDLEHMLRVADGEVMRSHWEELRRRFGVRVLGTWAYGARHMTGNRPIRSPGDLSGFRLRLPGAATWQASGKALGASPLPIAFSEVYMALQQGIADGQENPIPVIHAKGFHEVQRYLILTGHIQSSVQVLVNERLWQGLTVSQQDALQAAVVGLGDDLLRGIRAQEAELLAQWQADGTLEIIADVDVPAFERRAQDFFAEGFPFSSLYTEIARERVGTSKP